MKRYLVRLTIGCVVTALLLGCQRKLPQAPNLISPEDEAFFTDEPPTFVWSSEDRANSYVLRICKGLFPDDIFLEKEIEDTFYVMPQTVFDIADIGTYIWAVASMPTDGDLDWSEIQYRFTVGPPGTTYFPFGEGYEWVYCRHSYVRSRYGDEDYYDTISIRVTESSGEGNHLYFKLEGGSFADVGSHIYIEYDSLQINWAWETMRVHLIPQPAHYRVEDGDDYMDLTIAYQDDTLCITDEESPSLDYGYGYSGYYTLRLKGVGLIFQDDRFWTGGTYSDGHYLQLLYFIKGDTVWRLQ